MDIKFTPKEIEILQGSFKKACDTNCWELLYKKLFELDSNAASLFTGDIKDQQHRIKTMMKTVTEGLNNPHIIIPAVQELGRKHSDMGVAEFQYEKFKESLLYAIKETLGKDFDKQTQAAWEKYYDTLAETMKMMIK